MRFKLEINNKIIEQVMKFRYPDVTVTSIQGVLDEVKERVIKANKTAGFLNTLYGITETYK